MDFGYDGDAINFETITEHENKREPEFLFVDPINSSNDNRYTIFGVTERNPLLVEVDVDQLAQLSSYSEYFDGKSNRNETIQPEATSNINTILPNEIIEIIPKLEEPELELDEDGEQFQDFSDDAEESSKWIETNDSSIEISEPVKEEYKSISDNDESDKTASVEPRSIAEGQRLQCSQCDSNFNTKERLMRHIEYKHSKTIFKCTICHSQTPYKYIHRKHMQKHTESGLFECSHCYCKFNNKIYFGEHEQSHLVSPKQEYFAHTLVNSFDIKPSQKAENLTGNRQNTENQDVEDDFCEAETRETKMEKKYECSEETDHNSTATKSKNFISRGTRTDSVMDTSDRLHKCSKCSAAFGDQFHLKIHIRNVHMKTHNCKVCTKSFPTRTELTIHHKECYNSYLCSYCSRSFKMKTGMIRHEKTHKNEKPSFQCFDCKKMLRSKEGLQSHLKSHSQYPIPKIIRYHCDRCSFGCKNKSVLDYHLKKHEGIRDFQCEKCPKTFYSKHELERHQSCHTDERRFKCDKCSMKFKFKHDLKRHENIHLGIFKFDCEYCEKKFRTRENYMGHVQIHTGIKAFKCSTCSREFARAGDYNRHLKSHANL